MERWESRIQFMWWSWTKISSSLLSFQCLVESFARFLLLFYLYYQCRSFLFLYCVIFILSYFTTTVTRHSWHHEPSSFSAGALIEQSSVCFHLHEASLFFYTHLCLCRLSATRVIPAFLTGLIWKKSLLIAAGLTFCESMINQEHNVGFALRKIFSTSCQCSSKITSGPATVIPIVCVWEEEVHWKSWTTCHRVWLTCPLARHLLTSCFIPAAEHDGAVCSGSGLTEGIFVPQP